MIAVFPEIHRSVVAKAFIGKHDCLIAFVGYLFLCPYLCKTVNLIAVVRVETPKFPHARLCNIQFSTVNVSATPLACIFTDINIIRPTLNNNNVRIAKCFKSGVI